MCEPNGPIWTEQLYLNLVTLRDVALRINYNELCVVREYPLRPGLINFTGLYHLKVFASIGISQEKFGEGHM